MAQGDKQVLLGDESIDYGPGQSMLTTIDLPVVSHVTRASPSVGSSPPGRPASRSRKPWPAQGERVPDTGLAPTRVRRTGLQDRSKASHTDRQYCAVDSITTSSTSRSTSQSASARNWAGLLANAAAIVLAHNHPSGDPTPSTDDCQLTQRLVSAGQFLGVEVLDHIIVGDAEFVSLHQVGLL